MYFCNLITFIPASLQVSLTRPNLCLPKGTQAVELSSSPARSPPTTAAATTRPLPKPQGIQGVGWALIKLIKDQTEAVPGVWSETPPL